MGRMILVDGSGLMHRCYHANKKGGARDAFEEGDGMGAVTQFRKTLDRLMQRLGNAPGFTHFGTIFDASRSYARLAMFPEYKGNRPPLPDDFRMQVRPMKETAANFGATLEIEGYEADDIIATYARLGEEAGMEVLVVTQDKDLCQIVSPRVSLFNPIPKVTTNDYGDILDIQYSVTDEAGVVERWGASPPLVPDILAMVGDASDNIRGLEGIGEVGAKKLIAAFGDLETVLQQGENAKLTTKQRDAIRYSGEQARLAKQLIVLDRHVPVPHPIDFFETL